MDGVGGYAAPPGVRWVKDRAKETPGAKGAGGWSGGEEEEGV